MGCYFCTDPDGASCFPQYGVGPHTHGENFKTNRLPREQWPSNYAEDPDCPGMGTYWCPHCGDGKPATIHEQKEQTK